MLAAVLLSLGAFFGGIALLLLVIGLLCLAGFGGWVVYHFVRGNA